MTMRSALQTWPFHGAAEVMSMRKLILLAGGGSVLTVLAIAALAAILGMIHVDRIWGGLVERVDPGRFQVDSELIVITDVSVLAPNGAEMLAPRTVVIDQGKIAAISTTTPALETARTVDGSGLYLVPGLIDSHVHLRRQPNDLLLYLANGVTAVRDLSGSASILDWRDEVDRGERVGPRISVASPLLYTTSRARGWFRGATEPRQNVITPAGAAAIVSWLKSQGYDALKLYSDIDPEVFRAINSAARDAGIHTVGHLPFAFSLEELNTTELQEIGHIEELIKKLQDEFDADVHGPYQEAFPAFVAERSDAVIDPIIENDIAINTTLWLMEVIGNQAFDLRAELRRIPLEYANPGMIEGSPYVSALGWLPGRNAFEVTESVSAEERDRIEASWEARAEAHRILFRRMVERGVRLTAGTDATTHLMIPGFSMHEELASLVRNGMSPAEALRAAGGVSAQLIGVDSGVVEPGRNADLILLTANPLEDIHNTMAIEAVIADGRLFDRATLDAMLDSVERANSDSRTIPIDEFL
jgi:imidazolonepropionase-like amidohydrolase